MTINRICPSHINNKLFKFIIFYDIYIRIINIKTLQDKNNYETREKTCDKS